MTYAVLYENGETFMIIHDLDFRQNNDFKMVEIYSKEVLSYLSEYKTFEK